MRYCAIANRDVDCFNQRNFFIWDLIVKIVCYSFPVVAEVRTIE